MSTLLLRFAAPLQAWGVDSKFNRRATEREPTKSGVIGFLAAALGRRRDEPIADLAALRYGLRMDQPGQFLRDFHTAHNESDAFVTHRYYIADAVFLVGLEGDDALLQTIDSAIRSPVFPLYLGRRSCPPIGRVSLGIRPKPLRDALCEEPWQASAWYRKRAEPEVKVTLVCDAESPNGLRTRDMPISFSQTHRQYAYRSVDDRAHAVLLVNPDCRFSALSTEHDPFADLGG